ncbi:MAG: hypothetical protein EXS68_00120 [Candidatus Ryanbacteria bacterium]|nr:hypothetical protein [Candidatus Ryanbacteria bacterium]
MAFKVKVTFIDVFKIGDNINYNLQILKVLYSGYKDLPDGHKLIKPIVIINTSIVEALFFDFVVNRLKRPYRTEVLFSEIFAALKDKNLHRFENYISQVEKRDLFELGNTNFYEILRILSKKRNRIHIQNEKWEEPRDESDVFDKESKIMSEKILEKTVYILVSKFSRREEYHRYVNDFEFPWDRHFKE